MRTPGSGRGDTEVLEALGAGIDRARRRQRVTADALAAQASTSPSTLRRLVRGDPTVAIGTLVSVLRALGMHEHLGDLTATENDQLGLQLEDEGLPRRIVRRRAKRRG